MRKNNLFFEYEISYIFIQYIFYLKEGKVRQRVIEYIGKEEDVVAVEKVDINNLELTNVQQFGTVTILYKLCKKLNLTYLLGKHHKPIIALLIAH